MYGLPLFQHTTAPRLLAGILLLGLLLLDVQPGYAVVRDAGCLTAPQGTTTPTDAVTVPERRDEGRSGLLAPNRLASPLTLEERAGSGGPDAEQRLSARRNGPGSAAKSTAGAASARALADYPPGAVSLLHLFCNYRL